MDASEYKSVSGRAIHPEYIKLLVNRKSYIKTLLSILKIATITPYFSKSPTVGLLICRIIGIGIAIPFLLVSPAVLPVAAFVGLPAGSLAYLCYFYERGMQKRLVLLHSFAVPLMVMGSPLIALIFSASARANGNDEDDENISMYGLDAKSQLRHKYHSDNISNHRHF